MILSRKANGRKTKNTCKEQSPVVREYHEEEEKYARRLLACYNKRYALLLSNENQLLASIIRVFRDTNLCLRDVSSS